MALQKLNSLIILLYYIILLPKGFIRGGFVLDCMKTWKL